MTPLYATPQWIVVLLVPLPDGRTDKLPIDYRTGNVTEKGADGAHNPAVWTDHANAVSLAKKWGPMFTVGFVLTAADSFFCVDIDGALNAQTGEWSQLSQQLCQSLPNTCIEVSQSGRGLHIWGQGYVPPHTMKRVDLHVELYTERRFMAIGDRVVGDMTQPCPNIAAFAAHYFPPRAAAEHAVSEGPCEGWNGPSDDVELLRRAMQSKSAAGVFGGRATFADLWHADVAKLSVAYPPDASTSTPYDASNADAALAQHLAFWTGRDVARIERLMRQSALMRPKWDEREDYLVERTITNACSMQRDVLADKKLERAQVPATPPGSPKMTAVAGATFLAAEQIADLFKGCIYIEDAHRALLPGGKLVKPDQFRAVFGGYTFAMDARNERTCRNAWEAFTENQVLKAPRADGTCFRPDLPYGTIVHDPGRTRANTYWPVDVPRAKGDVTPFLNHLAKVLPNERDRMITLYMLAALVQHQGTKFQWAIVLQGVEGNGKTLFSRCVAEAIGRRYVHWPKASKLAKQFNGWMFGKTFFAVEDIHTSENVDVIEELKPMITGGDGLEIEGKGVDQISTEICGNFFFNTNHKSGLRKTRNDRRFCILYSAQQEFEHLARDGMGAEYMRKLYDWLRAGGYAIVSEFLWTLQIPDEFNPATGCQRAPQTSSTDAAIAAGMGRVEQEITEAIDQGLPGFAGGWVSSICVDRLLDRLGRAGSIPPNRRRDLMISLGYDYHPALPLGRVNNVILPDSARPRLYIRGDHPDRALMVAADAARAYTAAQAPR